MVTPLHKRIKKYKEGLNPMVIYLYVKKQRHAADLMLGVQTEKDNAIVPMLIPYGLDMRKHTLALRAWRELYFMGYRTRQKVVLNE
jgi:hypothetical protein